jgi:signal recognition particle receptor subunit beta
MATWDRAAGKIVVRVIYDGPGSAGKTTNIHQLCGIYSQRRRSEVFTPEERAGRTLYFDWLVVDAGLVAGQALRCQVITVPGQLVLAQRRARLLRTADVVVFVCESTANGAARVKRGFDQLQRFMRREGLADVPIVVQANKQDLPDAIEPAGLAELLGLQAGIAAFPARARDGVGVKETLLSAIHAAAARVKRAVAERGLEALAGTTIDGQALLRAMADEEHAGEWSGAGFEEEEPAAAAAPLSEAAPPPARSPERGKPMTNSSVSWPRPPRSVDEVPSGLVWPATSGRDLVKLGTAVPAAPRPELAARMRRGSHEPPVVYQAGEWGFTTAPAARYADPEAGRAALLAQVRGKLELGALAVAKAAVFLARAANGYQLWNLAPWAPTLRARMAEAAAAKDEAALTAALGDYAAAIGVAAVDTRELDLDPGCFAMVDGRPVYFAEHANGVTSIGPAILERVEEHRGFGTAIEAYVEALTARLQGAPRRHELASAIEATPVSGDEAAAARRRLVTGLARKSSKIIPVPPPRRADTGPIVVPKRAEATPVPSVAPVAAKRADSGPVPAPVSVPVPVPVSVPVSVPVPASVPVAASASVPASVPVSAPAASKRADSGPVRAPIVDPSKVPTVIPGARGAESAARRRAESVGAAPDAPVASEVMPGFVWPPTAHEAVRAILARGEADAGMDGHRVQRLAGRAFRDAVQGRAELHRQARAHIALGPLGSTYTMLVLAPNSAGQLWLWRVARAGESLREMMAAAVARRDPASLAQVLVRHAHAVVDGLGLARRGRAIDLSPEAFVVEDGLTVYAGDDATAAPAVGQAMLGVVDEIEAFPTAVARMVEAYERLLPRRLSRGDVDTLGLRRAIGAAALRSRPANEARERLARLLEAAWAE